MGEGYTKEAYPELSDKLWVNIEYLEPSSSLMQLDLAHAYGVWQNVATGAADIIMSLDVGLDTVFEDWYNSQLRLRTELNQGIDFSYQGNHTHLAYAT